jgi:hypothetical protein
MSGLETMSDELPMTPGSVELSAARDVARVEQEFKRIIASSEP